MTLSLTWNTGIISKTNAEKSISIQEAEELPLPPTHTKRDGSGRQAHKPEVYWTSQAIPPVFRILQQRSLSGAVRAAIYNLHSRRPQHFYVVSKSNWWAKKRLKGQAVILRDVGRRARNIFHSQSKSEQWVYCGKDLLGRSPKTKGCESGTIPRLGSGNRTVPGPYRRSLHPALRRRPTAPPTFRKYSETPTQPARADPLLHPYARGPSSSPWWLNSLHILVKRIPILGQQTPPSRHPGRLASPGSGWRGGERRVGASASAAAPALVAGPLPGNRREAEAQAALPRARPRRCRRGTRLARGHRRRVVCDEPRGPPSSPSSSRAAAEATTTRAGEARGWVWRDVSAQARGQRGGAWERAPA